MKILIVGSGNIGTAVAYALSKKGDDVTILKRSPAGYHDIKYIQADTTKQKSFKMLNSDFEYVLFIAAPDTRSEETYKDLYEIGLTNALSFFHTSTFIFVSSTAVYGQSQGELVDENSHARPNNFRAEILLNAEQKVLSVHEKNIVIRFSGIYGRGESHLLPKLKNSQEIQFEPPYYTNRIHREDCIGIIVFLLEKLYHDSLDDNIYLATDKSNLTLYALATKIAEQHGVPHPKKLILDKKANQNKRLSSKKLEKLGYRFKYPTYH